MPRTSLRAIVPVGTVGSPGDLMRSGSPIAAQLEAELRDSSTGAGSGPMTEDDPVTDDWACSRDVTGISPALLPDSASRRGHPDGRGLARCARDVDRSGLSTS